MFLVLFLLASITSTLATQIVNDHTAIIRFSSSSCNLCERNVELWESAVDMYKYNDTHHLYSVDCDMDISMCDEFNITRFPSFSVRVDGLWSDTSSFVTHTNLMDFLHQVEKSCIPSSGENCIMDTSLDINELEQKLARMTVDFFQINHNMTTMFEYNMKILQHARMLHNKDTL